MVHVPIRDVESDGFTRRTTVDTDHLRPGDDFNERGDHRPLLQDAGWVIDHAQNGTEYWRRPGKEGKWSATWGHIPNRLYVFSSNASPFEENRTYDTFSIYTYLKHAGDFEAAARDLASQGFGTRNGRRRTNRSRDESERDDEATLFEAIRRNIEKASTATDWLEQNRLVKAIIDRLALLEPIDQSMFIDQMKDAGLGSKGTLFAQLKEAIKAKQNTDAPQGAPTDFIHTDGEIRSAFGVYEGSTHYFKLVFDRNTNAYYPKPISSFILTPTMRVKLDGYDMFRVDCMTEDQSIEGEVMHRKDFNDKKRFKDALKSAALQFFGSDNDAQAILGIVNQYDVITKQGTAQLGRHDEVWVLPNQVLGADGWVDEPDLMYVPYGGRGELDNQIAYPELSEGAYTDFLRAVYTNLLNLNVSAVTIPAISWFWATPFKPLFSSSDGFPHLSIF